MVPAMIVNDATVPAQWCQPYIIERNGARSMVPAIILSVARVRIENPHPHFFAFFVEIARITMLANGASHKLLGSKVSVQWRSFNGASHNSFGGAGADRKSASAFFCSFLPRLQG